MVQSHRLYPVPVHYYLTVNPRLKIKPHKHLFYSQMAGFWVLSSVSRHFSILFSPSLIIASIASSPQSHNRHISRHLNRIVLIQHDTKKKKKAEGGEC